MRPPRNGEVLLDNPDEKWLRSTYPGAVSDRGDVGWEAFKLHERDNGELSGVRERDSSAEEAETARLRRARDSGRVMKTGGTWGVTVNQLADLELQCFDDTQVPEKESADLPVGHAFVDLVGLSAKEAYNAAVALAEAANENGRLCIVDPKELEEP